MATQPTGINAKNLRESVGAVASSNRADILAGIRAGLDLTTNAGETLNAAELTKLRGQAKTGDARIKELEGAIGRSRNPKKIARWQAELNKLTTAKTDRDTKIATLASPDFAANKIRSTFSEQYGMRDNLLGRLSGALNPTSEYNRMQDALGRGIQAQQADMERVQAQQTDEGMLGRSLMDEAQRKMAQGGQLSPEATRDAIQSARQGFASRGMATGSAALGAELLNRDRFARQREFQNLGFAQSVEANDLARRTANTQLRQQAGIQNADAFNQLSQFNTLQRDNTNRFNLGLLGQSAGLADQERLRQINVGQDQYNFAMSSDPRNAVMTIGQPFNRLTGAAEAGLNVASFNRNMQAGMFNNWQNNNAAIQAANITGRASTNAGMMSMFGGLAQGAGAYFSDERMKKDIKQTGKDGVLGLKTYEYRYKGEDKDAPKRTGFMAQDVAKVLPEAVEEVNYRGKKRLAIKPMVIGQTLAAALASQQDAMFADGYTVGKGFKG